MGHYLSETESLDEAAARAAFRDNVQRLHAAGYYRPGFGPSQPSSRSAGRGYTVLHHVPCGQAVFDADKHESFCPARAVATPSADVNSTT